MPKNLTPLFAALTVLWSTGALADLNIRFIEGAPKDRFKIENAGACTLTNSIVRLDMSGSEGALIFDVTASGAGVEVFQPLEITAGRDALETVPSVVDGQNTIALSIKTLAPGDVIAFTIDVDDTRGTREITVTGAEIAGATVSHINAQTEAMATFAADATATVDALSC